MMKHKRLAIMIMLIILSTSSWALFPNTPPQLTIIDQLQHRYYSTCPTLVDITSNTSTGFLKDTFSLLNWNIYKQQNQQWADKLKEWAEQADLITLQEAKHNRALINFSQRQQLYYFQNIAFDYDNTIYGVNTLSRAQPEQVCGTRYSEPWIIIPKTGLASTYNIQDSTSLLLLINLHGVNFTFTSAPLKEQVIPYFQLIKQHEGPIIITGDFNTWSDARTTEIKSALISLGFNEAQFTTDHRMTAFGLPLDHVFSRGLHVLKAQSISTIASDHSPQLVTFQLKRRENR